MRDKITKKNKRNILIGISVILIISIITAFILQSNPKVKVAKAIFKTNEEISSQKDFLELVTGGKEFSKSYTDGNSMDIQFEILSSNIPSYKALENSNINISSLIDNKNKKVLMNLGILDENEDTNIKLYTDNKEIMFKFDNFYDSWFTFECDNIMKQCSESVYGKDFAQYFEKDFDLKFFNDEVENNATKKEVSEVIFKDYVKKNKSELNKIFKETEVEKLEKKKLINVDGNKQACVGYSTSINKDQFTKLRDNFYNYVLNDEKGRNALDSYIISLAASLKIEETGTIGIPDISLERAIELLKENITYNDANINIYINSGKAVMFDIKSSILLKDEVIMIDLELQYRGKDNIADHITLDGKIVYENESFDIQLNSSKTKQDGKFENKINGTISNAGDKVILDLISSYDIKNKTISGNLDLKGNADKINVTYNGSYSYDNNDKNLSLDFDSIKFVDSKDTNIELKGLYSIKPLQEQIEEPVGKKTNLFKMTTDDFFGIYFELMKSKNPSLYNF